MDSLPQRRFIGRHVAGVLCGDYQDRAAVPWPTTRRNALWRLTGTGRASGDPPGVATRLRRKVGSLPLPIGDMCTDARPVYLTLDPGRRTLDSR